MPCKTGAGRRYLASTDLYGGTWNLFSNTFKDMGNMRFADPADPQNFAKLVDDRTRLLRRNPAQP